jgi:3-dehydroquinate dehydratase-2
MDEIIALLQKEAESLNSEIIVFQSNSEGDLVDYIQEHSNKANGIIINPGALTHYGLSLRDALVDAGLPVIEVHLSNIYARENWRANSVISPVTKGQVTGLGWRGYIAALRTLIAELKE